jgi:hypothetical protein
MMDRTLVITQLSVNLLLSFVTLGVFLKYHSIWVRLIDRMDILYQAYCSEHKIPFVGLKNGN